MIDPEQSSCPGVGQEWDGTTPPSFSLAAFEASLRDATGKHPIAARLAALWRTHEDILLGSWDAYVSAVEVHLEGLARLQTEMAADATAPRLQNFESIGVALARKAQETDARNAATVAAVNRWIDESNAFLFATWERAGRGVGADAPRLAAPSGHEVRSGGNDGRVAYPQARARAAELANYGNLDTDPIIRGHLWWVGLSAFVLGWILLHQMMGGLILSGASASAIVSVRLWQRRLAIGTYQDLVRATRIEQGRQFDSAARQVQAVDEELRRAEANFAGAHSGEEGRLASSLIDIRAAFQQQFQAASSAWRHGVTQCAAAVAQLCSSITEAAALNPSVFGPVQGSRASPATDPADGLAIRIGEACLRNPKALSSRAQGLLTLDPIVGVDASAARIPVVWDLGGKKSLLVSGTGAARDHGSLLLVTILSRFLNQMPPGKVQLSLFDPLGLGQSFRAFLKLKDYSEQLLSGQVATSKEQIRTSLKTTLTHIETITQNYLRNDFQDIESYNRHAGEVAEPYKIIAVADFPEGFDEDLTRDLAKILQNGPRCGVFVVMHVNRSAEPAHGVNLSQVRPRFMEITQTAVDPMHGTSRDFLSSERGDTLSIELDHVPTDDVLGALVERFGSGAREALRVEVSYPRLLDLAGLAGGVAWGKQRPASEQIQIPLGPSGAKKVQYLTIGGDAGHHALIAGRTGSGKSNLLHVLITAASRIYSPAELQFYLIDFKEGVEFKPYATSRLPHARVIAIKSEREFGLSVLQALDVELTARGRRFSNAGVPDLARFNQAMPKDALPRVLLVLDEFQRLFEREDRVAREASILVERLARQGRNFGINLILGTQSLSGAGLNRSTMDQMVIRIALPCSEADSRIILADDNIAARSLTRPGEAIYNEAAGLTGRNFQFQAALISDLQRKQELELVHESAVAARWSAPPPRIFDDFVPGDLTSCPALLRQPEERQSQKDEIVLWMGESTSMAPLRPPALRRQSGSNLLVLNNDEEAGLACLMGAMVSIAAQSSRENCRFQVLNFGSPGKSWSGLPSAFTTAMPHACELSHEADVDLLRNLANEIQRRSDSALHLRVQAPTTILVLIGVHRIPGLRRGADDGYDAGGDEGGLHFSLAQILREGPEVGVHVLAWCDTYANLRRGLGDRTMGQFGVRVAGRLSSADSDRVFDDQVASCIDKPHRLVASDAHNAGEFELFRVYALPTPELLAEIGARFRYPH